MEKYNKYCNKNFISSLVNKYNVIFYSDNDNQKYIVLKLNDKSIWASYKILCSYDIKNNYLKLGNDMIIIEKSMLDINFSPKNIKSINNLDEYIYSNIVNTEYIGFVIKKRGNINYYFGIKKIIRL